MAGKYMLAVNGLNIPAKDTTETMNHFSCLENTEYGFWTSAGETAWGSCLTSEAVNGSARVSSLATGRSESVILEWRTEMDNLNVAYQEASRRSLKETMFGLCITTDSIRPHVTYGYHPRRVARLGGRILSSKYTWTRYAAFCLQKFLCFKIARQNIIEGPQRAGMGF